jgi:starch synthase
MLCQEYEYPRFDCCSALGLLTGIPVFATFQGGDFQSSRVERLFRRWSVRTCAGLIIASEGERQRVQHAYGIQPDRMAAIFNPVDLDVWYPEDRAEARKALGIPMDARVAAWHGRIDILNKGLDLLIDAWRAIPRGLLLLAGDGRDSAALESMIVTTERVQWRSGYSLDRSAMRRYLSAADLYVFPSRHEGFAVAPLEAMACGLPVVATDSPVMRALGATIVPQNDSQRLAHAVASLLNEPARCHELGNEARRRIEADFAPTQVGARLHRFITESLPPARHQLCRQA